VAPIDGVPEGSGWAVRAGSGLAVELPGPHELQVLLRGGDVDGAIGVFLFTHAVITENPPHAHSGYMKIIYVLDGRYSVRVGESTFDASRGDLVVVPRGVEHTFTTDTGGRMLFVCSPSGNEEYFIARAELGADARAEDIDRLDERFANVGPVSLRGSGQDGPAD